MLEQLAEQIRNALARVQTIKKTPVKTTVAFDAQDAAAIKREGSEQPTERPTAKKEPPTRIVDPLYRGDFATIKEAITWVEPGTRILVQPGLYEEGLVIDKPLEIIGNGEPGEIVIQVAGMNVMQFQTTMGRVVNMTLRQMGGGKWFCVDIAQGRLELEDCHITSQSLACVAIHGGADPRLRRNRIHDSKDVGVYVYENAQGTLEDNDIFGNAFSGLEIKEGADPKVRHNRIHDGKGGGVYVYEGGKGTLEDNDIFGNELSEVAIKSSGHPILLRNRIHHSKQGSGVYVSEGGLGMLRGNNIFNNAYSGVSSRRNSNPTVRKNRINNNGHYGVNVSNNGGGTFEDNKLIENGKGAWLIDEDSKANVIRTNNKE